MAPAVERKNVMTGRRTMMVLATALLAGSLLSTGAQARGGGGGGGGGGGHGSGGGFSAGSMGGFGGGSCWWLWRRARRWLPRKSHGGLWAEITMAMEVRGYGGYYDYGSCPILHIIRLALHLHLLSGDPIRKLPARGFRNLQAFTGRARVQHNASSLREQGIDGAMTGKTMYSKSNSQRWKPCAVSKLRLPEAKWNTR